MKANYSISVGTVSGTVLSTLPHLSSGDIIKTIVLAAVGAAVSFLVSYWLRNYFKRFEK